MCRKHHVSGVRLLHEDTSSRRICNNRACYGRVVVTDAGIACNRKLERHNEFYLLVRYAP